MIFVGKEQFLVSTTLVSTKTDTINPGGPSDGFTGHYQRGMSFDVAMVEYCFYLESDPNDRTCDNYI